VFATINQLAGEPDVLAPSGAGVNEAAMQCRNCRFQNMPGTELCGRCGTSLGLATAVFDVNPPRAGRWTKRFRRLVPTGRAYYASRDAMTRPRFAATAAVNRIASHTPVFPPLAVMARMIVPGWSHFYVGQRWRGRIAMWGCLSCLVPGLFWFGTTAGSILIGLAFSVHSSAALDSFTQLTPDQGLRHRMAMSIGLSLLLFLALYLPVGHLITAVADPRVMQTDDGTFAEDDVVLVNHWRTPRLGSVVLYEIPEQRLGQRGYGRERAYLQFTGERVDRILAGPGDRVRWADGRLEVNGQSSALLPLNPGRIVGALDFNVPPGHVLILPSTTPQLRNVQDPPLWQSLSLVPVENIVGRAYVRSHPLRRFKLLR
jgi:type IV secretory pathway protease TraF